MQIDGMFLLVNFIRLNDSRFLCMGTPRKLMSGLLWKWELEFKGTALEEDIFLQVPTDMSPCTTLSKTRLTLRQPVGWRGYAQSVLCPCMSMSWCHSFSCAANRRQQKVGKMSTDLQRIVRDGENLGQPFDICHKRIFWLRAGVGWRGRAGIITFSVVRWKKTHVL